MMDGNTPAPADTAAELDVRSASLQIDDADLPSWDDEVAGGEPAGASDQPPPRRGAPEPTGDADEGQDATDGGEGPADRAADEEAEAPDDEAPEPEDKPEPEDDEAKAAKADAEDAKVVKIDGRDYTVAEIKRGYLRQADYTRKTQELAQARQQVEGHAHRIHQGEEQLAGILDLATAVLQRNLPARPDAAMLETDPMGYLRQERLYESAMREVQQMQQAQAALGQRTQAQREQQTRAEQEKFQQALAAEARAMREKIPELADSAKRDTFMRDALTLGAKHWGLDEAAINGIQDHRALLVLRDAIAYRKHLAAKPAALKQVQAAPPIPPSPRSPQGTRPAVSRAAIERHHREGSVQSAAGSMPDHWFQFT